MASNPNLTDIFTDCANAIRGKDGTTDQIHPIDFAVRITAIPSGGGGDCKFGSLVDGSITEVTAADLEGVTQIKAWGFRGCSNLLSIAIPDSITEIGDYAFEGCSSLKSVYITDMAAWCNINFIQYYSNPLYFGHNLYLNGEIIKDLILPETASNISNNVFAGCHSLTSIIIPDNVTKIQTWAFYDCKNLTSATIGNGVTYIGDYAFYKCTALNNVTIGNGVTSMGNYIFNSCSALTDITYTGTKAQWAAINKAYQWNYGITSATIHCSDGDVPASA